MSGRPNRFVMKMRHHTALAVSAVMVGTLLQAVATPTVAADDGRGRSGLPTAEKTVAGKDGIKVKPRKMYRGPKAPKEAPKAAWPKAGTEVVALPKATASGSAVLTPQKAKGLPIALGVPAAKTGHPGARARAAEAAAGGKVEARVLGRKRAAEAGVDGLLFSLSSRSGDGSKAGKTSVTVDYSAFAQSYGGGYASRLTLVELPECALTTPEKKGCSTRRTVPTTNDVEQQKLTAETVTLHSDASTVLAAVADDEGMEGDYKATQLSPSATWDTNLNTGDFTWSYGMPVPEVPGGLKPNVGLSYSSATIDGRTGSTNNQSSWVGDGFELWPGYIERRYKPCSDDGVKNADGNKPGDLCWGYDNAFISFNGTGGELVPAGDDEWKFRQDDGTLIKRLTSTNRGNGDDNGEYWRLTDPQGNRYYFGYNRLPGWASGKETTASTWTVPVFGDDAGEPCHASAFADSWCRQAWRWNLDYVVDRHGNAIAYHYDKETNSYGRNLKASDDTRYDRGGHLDRIEYGLKSSSMYTAGPLAKVDFTSSERCLPKTGVSCAADTIDDQAFYWYDTPWDLNCEADEDCDRRLSPTFWTRKRLTEVSTHVLKSDGSYGKVDSWKLGHRWGMADIDYQLLLDSIQRTGHTASPTVTLPKTTLDYTQMENRLDETGDGYAPFVKERLSTVADESGGQITVDYSTSACDSASLPTPQTNTTRCFPQYIGGSAEVDPELHWFNKYVVTSVTATDRTGGAPNQVTRYSYLGGAAWHYDDDDGLTKEKHKTWSQWRGYGRVRVQTGGQDADSMETQQDTYFLRGMHGDRKDTSGDTTKIVTVSLGEGEGDPITDHEAASGFAYKTVTYSAPGGKVLGKTVNRPWRHETARKVRDWGTVTANLTGTSHTRTWTSLDDGAGSQWRITSSSKTYDTVAGRITEVDDRADNTTAADNRCTRTTYATNTEKNILTLPSRVETVTKDCATTPDRSSDVISDIRTAYDGGGYGDAPTKGDATASAVLKKHDGTTATYLESGATFDSYGRELTTTDLTANLTVTGDGTLVRTPRTDGRTTTKEYSPATGIPTKLTETGPPAVEGNSTSALTTTTELEPLRGQPSAVYDANNVRTAFAYDALGRSSKVWLAGKLTGSIPDHEFVYYVNENQPVAVANRIPNHSGGQYITYTIYDGFLRERQAQAPGPEAGRIITDTFYDERGLVTKTYAPYHAEGNPSINLFAPDNALMVETQSRHFYDGLGRETEVQQIAGSGDDTTVLNTTKTLYGGDRITVIPPAGGTATTTLTDARGQATELRQHHHRAADAPHDTTAYRYTPRGELSKVIDPEGNTWEYTYDQLGRQITAKDPDKGTTTSRYDDRSQLTSTTDARDTTLAHVYDGLGRQTELREDSATGTLRAKWVYDTISGAKGHLAEAIRYHDGNAYTSKVTMYDRHYRPARTAVEIPSAEGALAGTYHTATSYRPSGLIGGVSYSAAGSLPGGGSTYLYDNRTLRTTSVYGRGYDADVTYSLTGKPLVYSLGASGSSPRTEITNTYEQGTQRLATSRVERQDINGVDRHNTYRYDEAGNVLSITDVSRSGTDNQCFTYDYLRRLTQAWAQPTQTCADAPSAGVLGGPAPYWHSYSYDKTGNRLTETQHDITGDTAKDIERAYDYPAPGSPQPHTLASVTTTGPTGTARDSYGYDESGNTTARTLGGDTQRLTWDPEGHLAKVTEPVEGEDDQVIEYLYDADGNRLIGRTPTETTLYLGHTEITLAKGTTEPKATRYVGLPGGHQAVIEDDGTVSFTIADHHGTGHLAIDASDLSMTQRRSLPFGGPRGEQPEVWPGTKGFVGGTTDTATGLTHLGAREYDPAIGRFISVDPIMDLADPQQIHGYTYANNNPFTWSDPTGLIPVGMCQGFVGCDTDNTEVDEWFSQNDDGTWTQHTVTTQVSGRSDGTTLWTYTYTEGGEKTVSHLTFLPESKRFIPYEVPVGEHHLWTKAKEAFKFLVFDPQDCADIASMDCAIGAISLLPAAKAAKLIKYGDEAADAASCVRKHSFLPGTDVLLADGTTKNIEDVEIGDKVVVTDPETGETATREVVATILTEDDKHFVDLTITTEDGPASLVSTTTHPFWVESEEKWLDAGELTPGMSLRAPDGATVTVDEVRSFTKRQRTHDLTVQGIHTYYVLAGQTPVLVHNSNGCINWASNSVKTWGHTFKTHGAGAKNTKALTDRARSTGNQQGQWLNNDAAADFLKGLHVEGAGPRSVRIPDGLGQVIMPDGSIVQARAATIVPSPNGLYKTGFPIIGPN
ncbi:RHS repeat-associated core domain-containing protein [Streptomyces barkulensis]|uniref:RHS repeat-associated core domain-containing protein n=1 Tax=Streptomyces barkulensis TaxID=1257026 RepID=UPI001F0E72F7|nr:RHS repeat-associated core domain-containing protein [Streptomyces barkulensis]